MTKEERLMGYEKAREAALEQLGARLHGGSCKSGRLCRRCRIRGACIPGSPDATGHCIADTVCCIETASDANCFLPSHNMNVRGMLNRCNISTFVLRCRHRPDDGHGQLHRCQRRARRACGDGRQRIYRKGLCHDVRGHAAAGKLSAINYLVHVNAIQAI